MNAEPGKGEGADPPSATEIARLFGDLLVEPSTRLVLDRLGQEDPEPWLEELRERCSSLGPTPSLAGAMPRDADEALLRWTAAARWLCGATTEEVPESYVAEPSCSTKTPDPNSREDLVLEGQPHGEPDHREPLPTLSPTLPSREIPARWQTDFLVLASALPEPWSDLFPRAAVALQNLHVNPGWDLRIPGYRVGKIVGHGGSGLVYEAHQENTNRRVAIKVMHPGRHDAEARARFLREGGLLGRLEHPGIVRVLDVGEWQQGDLVWSYLVTEFLDGPPLLALRGTREQRLFVFEEICKAVQHAHEHGIVHRDLHPGNILFGSDRRPRIVDFGIAKELEPTNGQPRTHTGFRMGTFPYLSPEQARGRSRDVTTRADVYALGAILYELLLEAPAIEFPRLGDPHEAVLSGAIVPPRQRDRSFPRDLEAIVRKAMRTRPEERYASAQELLEDVRRHRRCEPVLARRRRPHYVFGRFIQRNRLWLLPVFLLVLIALVIQGLRRADEAAILQKFRDDLGPLYGDIAMARDTLSAFLEHDAASERTRIVILDLFDNVYVRLSRIHQEAGLQGHVQGFQERERLREATKRGGDPAEIRRARKLLLDLRRSTAARFAGDPAAINDLHIALVEYGDTYKAQGQHETALQHYSEADGLLRELQAESDAYDGWIVYSAIRLAEQHRQLSRPEDAARELLRALHLTRRLLATASSENLAGRHRAHAVALESAAALFDEFLLEDDPLPTRHRLRELSYLHALGATRADPDSVPLRETFVLYGLGQAQRAYRSGDPGRGRALAEELLQELDVLVARQPRAIPTRCQSITCRGIFLHLALEAGHLDLAHRCFDRGREDLAVLYGAPFLDATQTNDVALYLSSAVELGLVLRDVPFTNAWAEHRAIHASSTLESESLSPIHDLGLAQGLLHAPTGEQDLLLALRLLQRLLVEGTTARIQVLEALEKAQRLLLTGGEIPFLHREGSPQVPGDQDVVKTLVEMLEPAIRADPLFTELEGR